MALNLRAYLGLDGVGFERGLNKARSQAAAFGASLRRDMRSHFLAAFGVGAFVAATKNVMDYAGRVHDMSKRLGISTDAFQELDFALKQTGSSGEILGGVFNNLAKA